MPRFFLGFDFSLFVLAAGYSTSLGGLAMRFYDYHPELNGFMPLVLLLLTAGMLVLYRAFAAHFLDISWKICALGKDERNWVMDLSWLYRMRRGAALAMGACLALLNNYVMMLINGPEVFSWLSLGVLGLATAIFHGKVLMRP